MIDRAHSHIEEQAVAEANQLAGTEMQEAGEAQSSIYSRVRRNAARLLVVLAAASSLSLPQPEEAHADNGYPYGTAIELPNSGYGWYMDENGNGKYDDANRDGQYNDPELYDPLMYVYRNCTSFAGWKLESLGVPATKVMGLHNGGEWHTNAASKGIKTGNIPEVGAAAVKPIVKNEQGEIVSFGHVAIVRSVKKDASGNVTSITIDEYNYKRGEYSEWTGKPSDRGLTKFVYFAEFMDPTKLANYAGSQPDGGTPMPVLERPVPGDFNRNNVTDMAVFRPSTGNWHIRGVGDFSYGQAGDIPVPADYNGDGLTDIAVYRPSHGGWHIRGVGDYPYGNSTDIPVPGDYNGDGKADMAVFRPSTGNWHIRGVGDFAYGQAGDIPVPGYYNADKSMDIAVYRPSHGGWHIRGVGDFPYGHSTDIPVPADYDGDGITNMAIYRPSDGGWRIRGVGDYPHGWSTDIPVPARYNNDAITDMAIYRPSDGGWRIRAVGDYPYGHSTDIPAVQTLNAFLLKQYRLIQNY